MLQAKPDEQLFEHDPGLNEPDPSLNEPDPSLNEPDPGLTTPDPSLYTEIVACHARAYLQTRHEDGGLTSDSDGVKMADEPTYLAKLSGEELVELKTRPPGRWQSCFSEAQFALRARIAEKLV